MGDREPREAHAHPHEPEIPAALDADGRCLVCRILLENEAAVDRAKEADEQNVRLAETCARHFARAGRIEEELRALHTEVDCRIEHGAESGGHLEYVRGRLAAALESDADERDRSDYEAFGG